MDKSTELLERILRTINGRYVGVWYAILVFAAVRNSYEAFLGFYTGEVIEFSGRGHRTYRLDLEPLWFYVNLAILVTLVLASLLCFTLTVKEMGRRRQSGL
jgi:hypothetical protein